MDPSVGTSDALSGDLSASTSDDYVHVPPADESGEMVHLNLSLSSEVHEEIPTLIPYDHFGGPDGSMIVVQSVENEHEEEEEGPEVQVSENEESDGGCGCNRSDEGEEERHEGDSDEFTGEAVKFELPPELAKNVVFLECESSVPSALCQICLIGTAHVSKESCDEVQSIIRLLKPQVVFLELCPSRVAFLSPNVQVQSFREMINIWKKGDMNLFGLLYSWFFAKVASQLEVVPGAEFRVAFEEGVSYGAKIILGDRPIRVTLRRTWAMMPAWQKVKLLVHMFFQGLVLPGPDELKEMLKAMGDVDMLTFVVQEMSKSFPAFMETIVHERDRYMSHSLLQVAKRNSSVVAVVGKGHLAGIKENWMLPITISDLLSIPEHLSFWSSKKLWTALGVSVAGVAIVSGYFLARGKEANALRNSSISLEDAHFFMGERGPTHMTIFFCFS